MGLSLDTPINFDVLLINTFITQLPVVFGELGCVSLAGVFERRFVISIATFELWFRETIVVFLGMIWHSRGRILTTSATHTHIYIYTYIYIYTHAHDCCVEQLIRHMASLRYNDVLQIIKRYKHLLYFIYAISSRYFRWLTSDFI